MARNILRLPWRRSPESIGARFPCLQRVPNKANLRKSFLDPPVAKPVLRRNCSHDLCLLLLRVFFFLHFQRAYHPHRLHCLSRNRWSLLMLMASLMLLLHFARLVYGSLRRHLALVLLVPDFPPVEAFALAPLSWIYFPLSSALPWSLISLCLPTSFPLKRSSSFRLAPSLALRCRIFPP